MKIIFVAKIDCLYLWETASDTFNACFDKLQRCVVKDKKYLYTISTIEINSIDSRSAY
jgi:hypothetical protein